MKKGVSILERGQLTEEEITRACIANTCGMSGSCRESTVLLDPIRGVVASTIQP